MPATRKTTGGRAVLLLVLATLVLATSLAALLAIWRFTSRAPRTPADRPPIELEAGDIRRLGALLAVMLLATIALLAFIVGAYLVMRVGRTLVARNVGGAPTEYVDAWARYRMPDERIAELTSDEPPSGDDSDRPDDQSDDEDDTPRRDA